MSISEQRIRELVSTVREHMATIFRHGPGNFQFKFETLQEQEIEYKRFVVAQERAAAFKKELRQKIYRATEQDKTSIYIRERLTRCSEFGAGYCDEFATIALAYLYTLCSAKERARISSATFHHPEYGSFADIDHVFIVFNCPGPSIICQNAPSLVFIYDPWINRLFPAQDVERVWGSPELTDAKKFLQPLAANLTYAEYRKEYGAYFFRPLNKLPLEWQGGEKNRLSIRPLGSHEIHIDTYEKYDKHLLETLLTTTLPTAPNYQNSQPADGLNQLSP